MSANFFIAASAMTDLLMFGRWLSAYASLSASRAWSLARPIRCFSSGSSRSAMDEWNANFVMHCRSCRSEIADHSPVLRRSVHIAYQLKIR